MDVSRINNKRKYKMQPIDFSLVCKKRCLNRQELQNLESQELLQSTVHSNLPSTIQECFLDVISKMSLDKKKINLSFKKSSQDHVLYSLLCSRISEMKDKVTPNNDPKNIQAMELERVSKKYEDQQLCAPKKGERACRKNEECEGKLMAKYDYHVSEEEGFICKEYLTPNEQKTLSKVKNRKNKLCLLCLRKNILLWYYRMRDCGETAQQIIQPHSNIINCEGEYKASACIYPKNGNFEGILEPFVSHERHHYRYVKGKKRLIQVNVDFHPAPELVGLRSVTESETYLETNLRGYFSEATSFINVDEMRSYTNQNKEEAYQFRIYCGLNYLNEKELSKRIKYMLLLFVSYQITLIL